MPKNYRDTAKLKGGASLLDYLLGVPVVQKFTNLSQSSVSGLQIFFFYLVLSGESKLGL